MKLKEKRERKLKAWILKYIRNLKKLPKLPKPNKEGKIGIKWLQVEEAINPCCLGSLVGCSSFVNPLPSTRLGRCGHRQQLQVYVSDPKSYKINFDCTYFHGYPWSF